MARETKLLFGLSDIKALRFTCNAKPCGAVQSFPIETWAHLPRTCSNDTAHDWVRMGSSEEKMLSQLKESLQALIKFNGTAAFKIQLEFDVVEGD